MHGTERVFQKKKDPAWEEARESKEPNADKKGSHRSLSLPLSHTHAQASTSVGTLTPPNVPSANSPYPSLSLAVAFESSRATVRSLETGSRCDVDLLVAPEGICP